MEQFRWNELRQESFFQLDNQIDSFTKICSIISDQLYGEPRSNSPPWISVLIPTFRRETLLKEAIESVLAQESVDFLWEILVVDNTPQDDNGDTPAWRTVRQIGDKRVLYYHNRKNIGPGYNWNRAAELARGEWLCFLHDDDLLCPDALNNIGRQIRAYRGKRPLGYLHARRIDFSDVFLPPSGRRYPPERLTRFGMLLSGPTGAGSPTCGTAIRKSAYMETGGICYDYACSADAVLCCQIMKNYTVLCSDRVLGGCRWEDNESLKKEALLGMIQADELLSKYLYQKNTFSRQWERSFGAAITWRNIHRKQKIAAQNRVSITEKEYQTATEYLKPGGCRRAIFLAIYAFYRFIRLLDGIIQGLRPKSGVGEFVT